LWLLELLLQAHKSARHETRVFFTVGLRIEAAARGAAKGAKHCAGLTMRAASGERRRCLRSETVRRRGCGAWAFPRATVLRHREW